MVVLRLCDRPLHVVPVYRIVVLRKSMYGFCRRNAKQQQEC